MDEAAWAVLAATLRSDDPGSRALGAAWLRDRVWRRRADPVERSVRDLLVDLLDSDDPTVRAAAVYGLGVFDDDDTFAALLERASDPSPVVRTEVVETLAGRSFGGTLSRRPTAGPPGELGALPVGEDPASDRVDEALPVVRGRLDDANPTVRLSALRFVGRAWRDGALDADACVEAVRPRLADANQAVREATLELCTRCWQDGSLPATRLAEVVADALDDPALAVRERALALADRLTVADPAVVDSLVPGVVELVADDDRGLRGDALGLLETFWEESHVTSERIAPAVAERVETDPSAEIRADAVRSLGSLDPPDAVARLAAALQDPDREVRRRAAQALADRRYCWADDAVVEGVVAAARAGGETPGAVVSMLRETADDRVVPGLLAVTRDPRGSTRVTAVRALAGVPAAHVTERLVACTNDPHRQVRADALRSLAGRRDERLPDLLLAGLDDDDPKVRAAAAGALERYTDRPAVRDRLAALVEDDGTPSRVRQAAVRAHPDYSRGDTDSLPVALVGQALLALVYPFLGLYVVVTLWRRDGAGEGIATATDWFVGWYPLAYLLGHGLYWAVGLSLAGVL